MSDELTKRTAGLVIEASSESHKAPPPWIVQATVVLQAWKHWGLLDKLRAVPWQRPCKRFVLLDVVLLLLLVAISNARGLRDFYRQLRGYEGPLASLWGRQRLLSRSGLLGALRALDADCVNACESLFCPT